MNVLHFEDQSLLPLPSSVVSMDGQTIDLTGSIWEIRASADGGALIKIDWEQISCDMPYAILSPASKLVFQHYIVYRIRRKKGRTIEGDCKMLRAFLHWLSVQQDNTQETRFMNATFSWDNLSEGFARGFLSWCLNNTADQGNYFSRLRTFYAWGVNAQMPEFDAKLLNKFRSMVAPGNLKGHHVRFRHVTKGPLSSEECELLVEAIKIGKGSEQDRALLLLHLELGVNPQATARIKNKDLRTFTASEQTYYHLDIPRVKKRTAFRETRPRALSSRLGELLVRLQRGEPDDCLFYWISQDNPEKHISFKLQHFTRSEKIISPRTGNILVLHARRLRQTIATDMAEDGASLHHIADVLDHVDLQNVQVYAEVRSSIAKPVADATDKALVPLVHRFQGRITSDDDKEIVPNQPNQVLHAEVSHLNIPLLSTAGLGICGRILHQEGLCPKYPPLSCYSCHLFVALKQGPHELLLQSLNHCVESQAEIVDRRILSQLDTTRAALQEVITLTRIENE